MNDNRSPVEVPANIDALLDKIEECRQIFGIKAARQLWEKMGLPMPPPELVEPLPEETRH